VNFSAGLVQKSSCPTPPSFGLGGAARCTETNGETGELLIHADRAEKGTKQFPMLKGGLLFLFKLPQKRSAWSSGRRLAER